MDSSGNGYDLAVRSTFTNYAPPEASFEKYGDGVILSTASIQIPANAALNTASFTWMLWVRLQDADQAPQGLIAKSANDAPRMFYQPGEPGVPGSQDTNHVEFDCCSDAFNVPAQGGPEVPAARLQSGVWTHVAGTYDSVSQVATLYVQKVGVASASGIADFNNDISSTINVCNVVGFVCRGELDSVFLFDRALSQSEIADVADNEATLSGEVGRYTFDVGDFDNPTPGKIFDHSATANHANNNGIQPTVDGFVDYGVHQPFYYRDGLLTTTNGGSGGQAALTITGDLSITGTFTYVRRTIAARTNIFTKECSTVVSTCNQNYALQLRGTGESNPETVMYRHEFGSKSSFVCIGTGPTITLGQHTFTIRRDNTARTVVVKVDGSSALSCSYPLGSVPTGGADGPLNVAGLTDGSQSSFEYGMHEFRIWDSLVSQATLDTIADKTLLGAVNYEQTLEGSETAAWFFENRAPSVDAGADRPTPNPGQSVHVTTTNSDPENSTFACSWVQLSGPAVVHEGSITSCDQRFVMPHIDEDGPLVEFRVTMSDGELSDVDTILIGHFAQSIERSASMIVAMMPLIVVLAIMTVLLVALTSRRVFR